MGAKLQKKYIKALLSAEFLVTLHPHFRRSRSIRGCQGCD